MVQKIIIICGPTCTGKTAVGVELAKKFHGEIVSADSQQVWRGFDVGTAKPARDERAAVPHHLIDIANPSERFDAAQFVSLADSAIADIVSRGRVPFVVGGTGMYIRMLLHGVCDAPPRDDDVRVELEAEIAERGLPALHARLAEVDPKTAQAISPNDRTRIVRALEIYALTGEAPSELRSAHGFLERRYAALKIGINMPRETLYERINHRCERMIAEGLVVEVKLLLGKHGPGVQPFSAVGYKEILSHVGGSLDLAETVELMKQSTRRFAKRQLTWFRADPEIRWHAPDDIKAITTDILNFLQSLPSS